MAVDLNITFAQTHDTFSAAKGWVPIVVSSIALLATAVIAWVTRSAQKDTNYRDIQKMFRDFYAMGSNNADKQKIIANIVNPQKGSDVRSNQSPSPLERIIILDYLVILESCYFESKTNKRHHNREMVSHEIDKN